MTGVNDFPAGTKVKFLPSPRSTTKVVATVESHVTDGRGQSWLVTKDSEGATRKARPGACTKV